MAKCSLCGEVKQEGEIASIRTGIKVDSHTQTKNVGAGMRQQTTITEFTDVMTHRYWVCSDCKKKTNVGYGLIAVNCLIAFVAYAYYVSATGKIAPLLLIIGIVAELIIAFFINQAFAADARMLTKAQEERGNPDGLQMLKD